MKSIITRGDCIDVLNGMEAESVDVVFADPPFNLNKKYSSYKDKIGNEEYLRWTDERIKGCIRVLKPNGSIFIYNIPKLLIPTANILGRYASFRHWIAWDSPGRPLGRTLQPSHYGILYYVKNASDYKYNDVRAPHKTCRKCKAYLKDYGGKEYLRHSFGPLIGDVWDDIHKLRHRKRRIDTHPCQLPVHLVERILLISTEPGDVVLDPFLGAGTTAIAAKRLGRRWMGIEIDSEYVGVAGDRVKEEEETKKGNVFFSSFLKRVLSIRDKDINEYESTPVNRKPRSEVLV
ncbi:MAG: site-specific DNA-methyltransferase [Cytophagales bacterium]|nr:site-specific DNA-methyltransferase [Cytophagales bacterium]